MNGITAGDYLRALSYLLLEMAPFLLLGFALSGLMKAFIPQSLYSRHLGRNDTRSVLKAIATGILLPLCSCGVIPATVSLRREGASRGACTAFTIATPQTGADCLMATISLMGLPFALLRFLAALATAFFGGWLSIRLDSADVEKPGGERARSGSRKGVTLYEKFREAFEYGFGYMLSDIGKWIVVGLLVAAFITVAVPTGYFAHLSDKPWLSMPLVLLLALPMYLCATGSIPIVLSLMLKGMSPGVALVMLLAGPAINAASIIVMGKVFGRRTLLIYIAAIVCGAIAFGLIADYLLPRDLFLGALSHGHQAYGHGAEWWEYLLAGIFVILLAVSMIRSAALKFSSRRREDSGRETEKMQKCRKKSPC